VISRAARASVGPELCCSIGISNWTRNSTPVVRVSLGLTVAVNRVSCAPSIGMSPQASTLPGFERLDGSEHVQSWIMAPCH